MKAKKAIKTRILLFFSLVMAIAALCSFYSLFTSFRLASLVDSLTGTERLMRSIRNEMALSKRNLDEALMTQRHEVLVAAYASLDTLRDLAPSSPLVRPSQEQLMVQDIGELVRTYTRQVEGVMKAKAVRDVVGYTETYKEADRIAYYIDIMIDKVLIENLNYRTEAYRSFSGMYQSLQIYNTLIVLSAIMLSALLIILFTDRLTRPLISLAYLADTISSGRFEVPDLPVQRQDEVGVTAMAFNQMKHNIRRYIDELQEKAEVERRLSDQRLKNLEMQHLLRSTEIASLRSQMNPHFLFNSLNTGIQLAILEEADRTAEFMGILAELFRHNVRRLWRVNSIEDELTGLYYYSDLLAIRFGDIYSIEISIPEPFRFIQIPPLVFQPLIENAVIHGFAEMEKGGAVSLSAENAEEEIVFRIRDNGCGIAPASIENALAPSSFTEEDLSSRRGVGLRNVILRLRLFFKREELVEIYNRPSGGTEILIRIPGNEVQYV